MIQNKEKCWEQWEQERGLVCLGMEILGAESAQKSEWEDMQGLEYTEPWETIEKFE